MIGSGYKFGDLIKKYGLEPDDWEGECKGFRSRCSTTERGPGFATTVNGSSPANE